MDLELFDHFTSSPAAGSSSSAALALPELPSLNNSLRKRQRLSSSNRHEDESDEEDQHEDKVRNWLDVVLLWDKYTNFLIFIIIIFIDCSLSLSLNSHADSLNSQYQSRTNQPSKQNQKMV